MLRAGASEVARVLAERRLLGQPWQVLDLVLVGGCLASGRPGEQQQQEEWRRQRGSDHLRQEAGAGCLLARSLLSRPWGRAGGSSAREAQAQSQLPPAELPPPRRAAPRRAPPRGLLDPFQPPDSPHLCSLASLLSRRWPAMGSHVYSESRVLQRHVTVILLVIPPPRPRAPGRRRGRWRRRSNQVKVRGPRRSYPGRRRSDDPGVDGQDPPASRGLRSKRDG